ncbi:MAG: glycosyltransferase family 2 protein [Planctomycetota bacterium]|jgi:hypothetical protein
MAKPDLSVVVTVVDGVPAVRRCLDALSAQVDPPSMEIFVPWDRTVPEIGELAQAYPQVQFPILELNDDETQPRNAFEEHSLFDRRRSVGLRAAEGRFLAMLEDRGRPHQDWARAMVDILQSTEIGVLGGAIDNAAPDATRWALFFCDFGRYQPPLEDSQPEYLSDINICYRREVLESVASLWRDRYQEAMVNWDLRRRGVALRLSDRPLVTQERKRASFSELLKERIHWGRVFAQTRGREMSAMRCLLWAAGSMILPAVLYFRHFRRQLRKRRNIKEFLTATPAMLLLLAFWSLGESIGYCEATRLR